MKELGESMISAATTRIGFENKKSRDIVNFISLRQAGPNDDLSIAELLTRTFISTYEKKLPELGTNEDRKRELNNVAGRRKNGLVGVAELGYRIIGTFALLHPESDCNEAWRPNGCTLRCVAIDPDFHGLDLSSLLLQEADRIARFWQAEGIYLHVHRGAHKVANLYENFGYTRDSTGDKVSHGYYLDGFFKPLNH